MKVKGIGTKDDVNQITAWKLLYDLIEIGKLRRKAAR